MTNARKPRSKTPKRDMGGEEAKEIVAEREVPERDATKPRQFGSLRRVVEVDASFFEPLPAEELDAWGR